MSSSIFQKLRILIVDDNPIDRLAAARALRTWPNEIAITEVDCNAAALEALENTDFDVVLLDYFLPDGNCLVFLETYKQLPEQTAAIVVLSSQEDLENTAQALTAGAHDFILKAELQPRYLVRGLVMARQRLHIEQEILREKQHLQMLATQDELSGLYNRRFFLLHLAAGLQRSVRVGDGVGVIMIDLDGFKAVNDSFGHAAGDAVLVEVARRLTRVTRRGDFPCRLGGDEFAVILHHIAADSNVQAIAVRFLAAFLPPIHVGNQTLTIGISAGIAIAIHGLTSADQLQRNADDALYEAKRSGKNCIKVFNGPLYQ
jgi:diguanylate cyclase (GGDEF)-like protein